VIPAYFQSMDSVALVGLRRSSGSPCYHWRS
jgi:hypothetical protein